MNAIAQTGCAFLINALVLGVVLWLGAQLASRAAAPSTGPELRHRVWVAALLLQATLSFVFLLPTGSLHLPAGWRSALLGGTPYDGAANITVDFGPVRVDHMVSLLSPRWAVLISALFAGYATFATVRFAVRLLRLGRLARAARPCRLPTEARARMRFLAQAFGVGTVRIGESDQIAGPATFRFLGPPTLLVPRGFLDRVSPADRDVAIAHEFAHMAREDFHRNLLYELLALPFAWHPLVKQMLTHIAETREMVCDRQAAEAVGGALPYARSLLRLAAVSLHSAPVCPTPAIGIFDATSLERRLTMLQSPLPIPSRLQGFTFATLCALSLFGSCGAAWALHVAPPHHVGIPVQAETPSGQGHAPKVSGGEIAGNKLEGQQPVYPAEAKAARIQGSVVLKAIISAEGNIENLEVVSGPPELREASVNAVRTWKYRPYLLNGQPTEVKTTINVNFQLES